jgi:nucleotide-binding universal stress UspA family protein
VALYERILVPVEGTETDAPVLAHVAKLAALTGAEVILLRAAHFHTRDERACELDDAKADIERAAAELRDLGLGLVVRTLVVPGEPGEVVVSQATEQQADLIAMATHGHGWAKRLVLGSTAEHVRHNTDVPLLLIKEHAG